MSQQVHDALRAARAVIEVGNTHGEAIGAAVDKNLAPHAPRGARLDTIAFIRTLITALAADADALERAQDAYDAELTDDAAPRRERDAALETLYTHLVSVRSTAEIAFGPEGVRDLGFTGDTPRDPRKLLTLTRALIHHVGTHKLKPIRRGLRFDLASATEELPALASTLEKRLDAVQREAKEAEAALLARNTAFEAHAVRLSVTAGLLEELCVAAGMHELAARVRPATRRVHGTARTAEPGTDGNTPAA